MKDGAYLQLAKKNMKLLPWYDRDVLRGMVEFGPDEDGFIVIVTPQGVGDLQAGTLVSKPKEAFGQLMGKIFADEKGCFTVIVGAVYALHLDAGPDYVKLMAEEMGYLRREASRRYPTAEFVGWTHSHRSYSEYSSIDREEQKTWDNNNNIGILTFMEWDQDKPWAIAYRGPHSKLLLLRAFAFPAALEQDSPKFQNHQQSKIETVKVIQDSAEAEQFAQDNFRSESEVE